MDVLAEDGSAWRREFAQRVRPFRARWRWQRLVSRTLTTLWLPTLGTGILLALLRFTLVDLPSDNGALALPWLFWVLALIFSYLLDRPSPMRVARAIDTQLQLDERLSTALAFAQTAAHGPAGRLLRRQRLDALELLTEHGVSAVRTFRPAGPRTRRPLLLAGVLALLLVPVLVIPSPVAATRAERAALRAASTAQADRLAALRRELIARPELAAGNRELLAAQLAAAEASLRAHPGDRAANVAALSQADDALRALLPPNAAQIQAARTAAARSLQSILTTATNDSPSTLSGNSDLEKAASAAQSATGIQELVGPQRRAAEQTLANNLDRIASGLEGTDPALAAAIHQAADALRQGGAATVPALQDLAKVLQQTAQSQAAADLLAGALGQLDDGKQQVAQAGLPAPAAGASTANRPFGRRAPGTDPAAAPAAVDPGAAPPAAADGAGTGADQPSGPSTGAGPSDGTNGGPGTGDSSAPNAGSASAAGGPGNTQVQGNVQGGGGTTDGSANQTGTGSGRVSVTGTDQPSTGTGSFEPVYVPGSAPADAQGGPQERIPGVESPGQATAPDTTAIRTGPGYQPGVKTPYNRVVGQYRDAAAQALDHTVIPADAKQYVRDYFDSIAPAP